MLHLVTGTNPRTDCNEDRARVQFTNRPFVWEGAARAGGVCRVCDGAHLLRQYLPKIWPHLFRTEYAR